MNRKKALIIGSMILLALLAGALVFYAAFVRRSARIAAGAASSKQNSSFTMAPDFETLATGVEASVVSIITERHSAVARDPFAEFFGRNGAFDFSFEPDNPRWTGLGSGFIVNSGGYVLTNDHVIENAYKIRVRLNDDRILDAVVVGTDPKADLAILKINGFDLPALRFAPSGDAAVGDWVAAFGSPFGLTQTMTAGIISAKGVGTGSESHEYLLETDAAINPGNSGGPLVNLRGEVVGINTTIPNKNREFTGIGFAIPAAMAQQVYDRLIKPGQAARGWIGVLLQEVTPEIARSFHLGDRKGALVSETTPNGPAAKAGLKPGDIILEFDGNQIQNLHDLSAAVAGAKAGVTAGMKILRDGKPLALEIVVGERPSAAELALNTSRSKEPVQLGITVENVTPEMRAFLGLSSTRGVLVIEVNPDSPADYGGVQPGDVIHAINHSPVRATTDLVAAMRNLVEGSTVLLQLERHGKMLYLAFPLP